MTDTQTIFFKGFILSAICILAASTAAANAESWKTIHSRENNRVQIDLQSIVNQKDTVFANTRQISNDNNVFSTTEMEMDCEGKVSLETVFIPSESPDYRTREYIHFMQDNGEWWDLHDVEKGNRDCTSFTCKLLEGKSLYKDRDRRLGKHYDLLCRD